MKTSFLLASLLALAGCGISANKACSDLATARCNKRASCTNVGNPTGAGIMRDYGDLATCIMRETLSCTDALSAKNQGNTPELTEMCVTTLGTMSCTDFLEGNFSGPCAATGTLANGASCAFNGQCMTSYCNGDKHAACGTCGAAPVAGADCSTSSCERSLDCLTQQSSASPPPMTCVAWGTSGAMCNRENPCSVGLSCVGANNRTGVMGTCMAAGETVGAACDPTQQTAPGCDRQQGLWCNAKSKTCTAIAYAATGATCGEGSDGNFTDCKAGDCFGATTGLNPTPGTCKARVAEGAACDYVNGPNCLAPAKCVTSGSSTSGTCQLADGSKC